MKKCILGFMIFIMIFLNGCIEKKVSVVPEGSTANDFLVYDMDEIPEDLVQLSSTKVRDRDLLLALFEGLVRTDENGDIVPGIAESWTIGQDGINYIFKIRDDAKWSDGTEIRAQNFVDFFKDILSPNSNNIYSYQLYSIFGAEDYKRGNKTFDNVAIKANDDNTLQIRLNAPANNFLDILSQPVYTLRKVDKDLSNYKQAYKNIVYSGPFGINGISETGDINLTKNKYYYGQEEVRCERLYITSSGSSEKALASFETGKINVFVNPPVNESKNLIENGEGQTIPINSGSSINFNLNKQGIINNVKFRNSLSLAIDRETLVKEYLDNTAVSASAYVKDDDKNKVKPLINESGDVALAQKLLEESGYGDKKEKIKFIYLDSTENKKLCENIVKDIKQTIGVSIEAVSYNEDEFSEAVKSGNYHMAKVDYNSTYNDSISFLEPWISTSKFNIYGYKSSEFDNLILKAKREKDSLKRKDLINKAEELLINDMPSIPLYFHNIVLCKKSNIEGIYITKEGNIKLDRAYIY